MAEWAARKYKIGNLTINGVIKTQLCMGHRRQLISLDKIVLDFMNFRTGSIGIFIGIQ